uniref:Uncharacterized protein n=1 Tax=Anguilla anguilla TaxID=7936 RepID=A0A0E9UI87_ANGAN
MLYVLLPSESVKVIRLAATTVDSHEEKIHRFK